MSSGRSSRCEEAMLDSLGAHRLLTASQLRELNAPHAGTRWTEKVMARLLGAGLVDYTHAGGRRRVYYLTPAGHHAVGAGPPARTHAGALATGPLRAHTLAVNDVGVAFVAAARARGDEFGPRAWRHEVAHPIGPPAPRRRSELVIADAVLTYLQYLAADEAIFHYRFLELDRATEPTTTLAGKLRRYARLLTYTTNKSTEPLWRQSYPVFPEVLVVLTGAPPAALRRRAQTVRALCRADALLARTPQVTISMVLLDELLEHGPWAPIFRRVHHADPVTWTGQTP